MKRNIIGLTADEILYIVGDNIMIEGHDALIDKIDYNKNTNTITIEAIGKPISKKININVHVQYICTPPAE